MEEPVFHRCMQPGDDDAARELVTSEYALANPIANGAEYLVYLLDGGGVTQSCPICRSLI
jgi:hypothetical protein